jgi:hypothetical protein
MRQFQKWEIDKYRICKYDSEYILATLLNINSRTANIATITLEANDG